MSAPVIPQPAAPRRHSFQIVPLIPIFLSVAAALIVGGLAKRYPEAFPTVHRMAMPGMAMVGDTAPDFTLDDSFTKPVHLAEVGRPTLLVFYMGSECPHCVSQLLKFKKEYDFFARHGVHILAISSDPPIENLQANIRYGGLPYTLLSDPDHAVAASYGTYNMESNALLHGLFLIDGEGKIAWSHVSRGVVQDFTPLKQVIDPAYEPPAGTQADTQP